MHDSSSKNPVMLHKGWSNLIRDTIEDLGLEREAFIQPLRAGDAVSVYTLRSILYQFYEKANDELLLFDIAKHVTPLTFGSFSLNLWTAPDVKTLLENMCRYSASISVPIRLKYHQTIRGDVELWVLNSESSNKENHLTYMGAALFMTTMTMLIRQICRFNAIHITVQTTSDYFSNQAVKKYASTVGISIQSGYPVRKICISKKDLHMKLPSYDKDIHFLSLGLLRQEVGRILEEDIVLKIYNLLNKMDNLSEVSGKNLAAELNVNIRTLNRRLSEYGTSYKGIVDKFKMEKALYLLENPHGSMAEIAYQLGFSDLSTFSRAFKRWTGKCPTSLKRHSS